MNSKSSEDSECDFAMMCAEIKEVEGGVKDTWPVIFTWIRSSSLVMQGTRRQDTLRRVIVPFRPRKSLNRLWPSPAGAGGSLLFSVARQRDPYQIKLVLAPRTWPTPRLRYPLDMILGRKAESIIRNIHRYPLWGAQGHATKQSKFISYS